MSGESESEEAAVPPAGVELTPAMEEARAKLQAEKMELQKLFNMGNFPAVLVKTEEALKWAKALPPVISTPEIVQLYVNASSALVQMSKTEDAEKYASSAVLQAEIAVTERPGQPQAIELLSIATGSKVIALLAGGKLDQATEAAEKALAMAENIYPKNDPRLHKSLRNYALCLDKKGDASNAEKNFLRAHTILGVTIGHNTPECQLLSEDLVNLHLRKGDLDKAESYARKNHKVLTEKGLAGRELAFLADAATRLATILVKKDQHAEAEPFLRETLSLREKLPGAHPLTVAFALVQLAGVMETQNKVTTEVEALLKRALDIFARTKGPNCPEVANTLTQLRSVSAKLAAAKQSRGGPELDNEDDDEGLQYRVTSESKPARSSAQKSSGVISEEDRKAMSRLPPNNPMACMELAGKFYEQGSFNGAEELLTRAHGMFLKAHGPDHPSTSAAQQNLAVVRNNRVQQLWMEVVAEEMERLALGDGKPDSTSGAIEATADNLDLEEKLLASGETEVEEKQSGCAIC